MTKFFLKPRIFSSGQEKNFEKPQCTQEYIRISQNFLTHAEKKRRRLRKKFIDWIKSDNLVAYPDALAFMENRIQEIRQGSPECIWFLEHPPLYTAGTSAKAEDLVDQTRFPVFETGRGGQFTYHGPGQRVVYIMLDLNRRIPDIRRYVATLEQWIIETLKEFGIDGFQREGRVGIWVNTPQGEEKIAAIGVRVSKWITYHGLAINVNPDLDHFKGIVPCGLPEFGVTSFHKLGKMVTLDQLDNALKKVWFNLAI